MTTGRDVKLLGAMAVFFVAAYFVPLANPEVTTAIVEAFELLQLIYGSLAR